MTAVATAALPVAICLFLLALGAALLRPTPAGEPVEPEPTPPAEPTRSLWSR